jgi:uncharacterized protein (DUF305 family)
VSDRTRTRYSEADVDFMIGMLSHHEEGRWMAELAIDNSDRRDVQILAMRIFVNYEAESAVIRQWLLDRYQPLPKTPLGSTLIADSRDSIHELPGLLSSEQIEGLEWATGPEFDRQFLTLSIQHHAAAVLLAESLLGSGSARHDQTVSQILGSVHGEQAAYISHMERLLVQFHR